MTDTALATPPAMAAPAPAAGLTPVSAAAPASVAAPAAAAGVAAAAPAATSASTAAVAPAPVAVVTPAPAAVVAAPAAIAATPAPAVVVSDSQAGTGKSFFLWTADRAGIRLQPQPPEANAPRPKQDSSNPAARQIIYSPNDAGKQPPPADQIELIGGFERVIHALNHLYPPGEPASEAKFRFFYRSVFGLAQLTLEKENGFDVETAKKQLDGIKKDIIDDEAPRVKNSNIKEQLRWAAWICIPFAVAYVVLSHVPDGGHLDAWLRELGASRSTIANFMLLWVGCCLGVSLSYVLRKPDFGIEDLVTPESDFLTPAIRLGLTGTLTMLLVIFSMLKIFDVSIASHALSDIANQGEQTLAFAVGVLCGIGEQLLPSTIMNKTKAIVGGIK